MKTADLLLSNAHIVSPGTNAPQRTHIAVAAGRIVGFPSEREMTSVRNTDTVVIDCGRRTVIPGFIDAHCHLKSFAESLVSPDLSPRSHVTCMDDIRRIIARQASTAAENEWIVASGYDECALAEKRHPMAADLDAAAPGHPVLLKHRTGHAHVLSSKAMEQVGLQMDSEDPPGGMIDRQLPSGRPTGLLFEMGAFLSQRLPPMNRDLLEQGIRLAGESFLSKGITTIEDAGHRNTEETWQQAVGWKKKQLFAPRLQLMMGTGAMDFAAIRRAASPPVTEIVSVCRVKILLDETTGALLPAPSELEEIVETAQARGLPVAIHALTQSALQAACRAIGSKPIPPAAAGMRHRIEHASVCSPEWARCIAKTGAVVVTQPGFIHFNGDRYLDTVPAEDLQHLYPIGTLMSQGVTVAAGSDCPVVPPAPLLGIRAAATRQTETGNHLGKTERISVAQALAMHTLNAAHAMGIEKEVGSIHLGKRADMAILNADPLSVSPETLGDLRVVMTIVDGNVVWEES